MGLYLVRKMDRIRKCTDHIRATPQEKEVFLKVFVSKCEQIHSFLRIYSHLLEKLILGNFIF